MCTLNKINTNSNKIKKRFTTLTLNYQATQVNPLRLRRKPATYKRKGTSRNSWARYQGLKGRTLTSGRKSRTSATNCWWNQPTSKCPLDCSKHSRNSNPWLTNSKKSKDWPQQTSTNSARSACPRSSRKPSSRRRWATRSRRTPEDLISVQTSTAGSWRTESSTARQSGKRSETSCSSRWSRKDLWKRKTSCSLAWRTTTAAASKCSTTSRRTRARWKS